MSKMIFGAVYRRKHYDRPNDQHYHIYIPVAYKDKNGIVLYRMVDTYEVKRPSSKVGETEYDTKIKFLEQAYLGESSWNIFYGPSDYYYQNYYNIGSDELNDNDWELIADLHHYKIVSDDEAREYSEDDTLTYIPLWNEDRCRWGSGMVGSCFVKNGAQKDGWRIYNKALDDYPFGFASDYRLDKVEQTCENVLDNMKLGYGKKKVVRNTLKKIKKYKKLSKEYDAFCKSLVKEEEANGV